MKRLRVLVTGGTGFVGRNLIHHLKNGLTRDFEPSEILLLTRKASTTTTTDKIIRVVQGDLTDPKSLKNSVEDVSAVFHLAANADDWASWKQLYKANVEGTANLVDAFLKYADGETWVQVSSAGIYGHYIPDEPVNEDYPPNPTSEYQRSKLLQEEELLQRADDNNLKLCILRTPSIIGPGDTTTTLPAVRALAERSFPQVGDGKNSLTFTNVLDLTQGMILAAKNLGNFNEPKIWNIYSFITTLREYQSVFCDLLELPMPKKLNFRLVYTAAIFSEIWAKITGKKTTLNRYRVTKFSKSRMYDMTKIQQELGFKPRYDLQASAQGAVEWLIQHGYIESPRSDQTSGTAISAQQIADATP
ncbi:MAG: NAD-dependent epimerase/dehydratase family protein [Candidatus Heimdallarchaeota archaeon]